jgi:lysophospholipase L1-like esterase
MDAHTSSRTGHAAMLLALICSVSFLAAACGAAGLGSDSAATEQSEAAVKSAAQKRETGFADVGSAPVASPAPVSVAPSGGPLPVANPPSSGSVEPAPTPKVVGTQARPLRVVLLGDSMTRGDESNPGGFRSYRGALYNRLVADGLAVDFLGVVSEPPAVGGDPDVSAWGGMWIGPGGDPHNVYDRLPETLSPDINPDVVVLALGWNSVINESGVAADKYANLVNRVAALKPGVEIIVATLSPLSGDTEAQSNASWIGASYAALNRRARELANASASDGIHLADLAAISYMASDYIDLIHWRQSGADKAAQAIHQAIRNGVLARLP